MAEPAQSTENAQYNQIVDAYTTLHPPDGQSPPEYHLARVESHQVYLAVSDPSIRISGKRVLDLASGNGFYASKLLSWGAESVTGVDISTGMLEAGRRSAKERGIAESKLKFVLADVTDENLTVEGAPFDLFTGFWLLNYAPDVPTMTKMYKFIGRNLKPDGCFVSMTVPPLLTDQPYEGQMLDAAMKPHGAWGRHGQTGKVLKPMPNGDGYYIRVELGMDPPAQKAVFNCYHLRLKVFEHACAESGMFEPPEWKDFVLPEDVRKASPKGHWNDLCLWPSCRVFTAKRLS